MKKLLTFSIGLLAFGLMVFAGAQQALAYTHTVTLKYGSRGTQVMELQQTLNHNGFAVATVGAGSPGFETTYFGPATKSAVIRFQSANGLAADGIVGPMTGSRLQLLTGTVTYPAGCTSSAGYSTTTGLPCSGSTSTVPGCLPGYLFSPTTGQSCTSTPTNNGGALQGGAGDITTNAETSDLVNPIIEGSSNQKVVGFRVEATGSDVLMKSLSVTLDNNSNNGSTRIDRYIDSVAVYMGNTKVGSADINDFTRGSGQEYTTSITLNNSAIVRQGSSNRQTFYLVVTANNSIDTADMSANLTATVDNIRFQDAQGAIITSNDTFTKTFGVTNLANSGDVRLRISRPSTNPDAQTVMASDTASTSNVPLLQFQLNSQGTDVSFDQIGLTVTSTGHNIADIVDEFQIREGTSTSGSVVGTIDGSSFSGTSDTKLVNLDDTYKLSKNSTQTFTVYAKINKVGTSTFAQGDTLRVSLSTANVRFEDQNGDVIQSGDITGTATGEIQTFLSEGVNVTNFTSSVSTANNQSGQAVSQTYTLSFNVSAFGGTFYIPKNAACVDTDTSDTTAGVTYTVQSSAGATVDCSTISASASSLSSNADTVGGYYEIPDGSTRNFSLTVAVSKGTAAAGFYRVQLNSVRYDTDQSGTPSSINLVPAQSYQTSDRKLD